MTLPIVLKTKEGMPSGASPSLGAWVFLEYYLGVPWASPILGSFHSLFHSPSNPYPKLENFTTQKSTKNLTSSVSIRKQKTTSRYCNELIIYLYWCYTYCIPTFLWIINYFTSHRFIKISMVKVILDIFIENIDAKHYYK